MFREFSITVFLCLCTFHLSTCVPVPAQINYGPTKAAVIWRKMMDADPYLASQATMYWRMMSADDPKGAADASMQARKLTAANPEKMFKEAIYVRSKRSASAQYEDQTQKYWRKFAANDPEVAARSSAFWMEDKSADMYW